MSPLLTKEGPGEVSGGHRLPHPSPPLAKVREFNGVSVEFF